MLRIQRLHATLMFAPHKMRLECGADKLPVTVQEAVLPLRTPEISELNSTWEGGRQRMRNAFSNLIFAAIEIRGREMFWPPSKIKHRGHRVLVFVTRQLVACFCQKKSSTGQILPTLETWKTLLMIDQNFCGKLIINCLKYLIWFKYDRLGFNPSGLSLELDGLMHWNLIQC